MTIKSWRELEIVGSLQGKSALSMVKGCKSCRETAWWLQDLWLPQQFPCRDPAISSPRSFYGQNICSVHTLFTDKVSNITTWLLNGWIIKGQFKVIELHHNMYMNHKWLISVQTWQCNALSHQSIRNHHFQIHKQVLKLQKCKAKAR